MTGENLIDGMIYKQVAGGSSKPLPNVLEDLLPLTDDMEHELARVTGIAIDKPFISGKSYGNWAGVHFADPIPAELAMPSDIRFREDLIALKQEAGIGKGKVLKGKLTKK